MSHIGSVMEILEEKKSIGKIQFKTNLQNLKSIGTNVKNLIEI